jgi:UDP-N-acetylglucosamine 1-carboxyvinyltransferase
VVADRIEAGTFLCAAAATRRHRAARHPAADSRRGADKLREAGATVETGDDWIRLAMPRARRP